MRGGRGVGLRNGDARADEESGGPNRVEEDEDCISPSESDDVCDPSIGGSEECDGAFGKGQLAITHGEYSDRSSEGQWRRR